MHTYRLSLLFWNMRTTLLVTDVVGQMNCFSLEQSELAPRTNEYL